MLNAYAAYSFFFVFGMVFAVFWSLDGARVGLEGVGRKVRVRRNRSAMIASLPGVVREKRFPLAERQGGQLETYLKGRIDRAGWGVSPRSLILFSAGSMLLAPALVALAFHSVYVVVTVALLVFFLPVTILNWAAGRYENKVINQLPAAIQLFAIEYEMTRNIKESLNRAAQGSGEPLKGCIEQCVKDLGVGTIPSLAFERFAANLGCGYGRIWANMLLASTKDATMIKVMPGLIKRLGGHRILKQKNLTELSSARKTGNLLNILILPGFVATQIGLPDSIAYYSSPTGRFTLVMVVLSVVASIVINRILGQVDF